MTKQPAINPNSTEFMFNNVRFEAVTKNVIIAASDTLLSVNACLMLLVMVVNNAIPAKAKISAVGSIENTFIK